MTAAKACNDLGESIEEIAGRLCPPLKRRRAHTPDCHWRICRFSPGRSPATAVLTKDYNVFLNVPQYSAFAWKDMPSLLPYSKKFFLFTYVSSDVETSVSSGDSAKILNCSDFSDSASCESVTELGRLTQSSIFCIFLSRCIPVVPSLDIVLPFQDHIDWRRASIPLFHGPESWARALIASLREKLGVSPPETVNKAVPLFNDSFIAPILTPINLQPLDDEYLGPSEGAVNSGSFLHNFSSFTM
ncbi:unnamed protein product [Cylicocyclus nassatus]|uniref:Uncharacterized protein n=1 Tax=Cylicocyclus nassatus TaxID=53992 RepID=A0AA36GZH8_CYLNA|nr:unnamed protein product [Cylicocyclus nassatus]